MAFGTRGVFAVFTIVLLVIGVVATYRGRDQIGIWAVALGFASASFWSILGFMWTQNHADALPENQYIALGSMAVVATIYYGFKAMNARGLKDEL